MIDLTPDDRMEHDPGRNAVSVRASARVTTRLLSTRVASRLPMIGLTEFPKSGGTWVGQVLSTYLGVPFPQRPRLPILMRAVWHGHWTPPRTAHVLVVRDPRDCYVSLLHHRIAMARSASSRERRRPAVKQVVEQFPDAFRTGVVEPEHVGQYFRLLLDGNQLGEPDWQAFHTAWQHAGLPAAIRYAEARQDAQGAFRALIRELFGEVDEHRLTTSVSRYDVDAMRTGPGTFVRRAVASDGWRGEVPERLWDELDAHFGEDPVGRLFGSP